MRNSNFFHSQIARKFWIPKDSKISVIDYISTIDQYEVAFIDLHNHVIHEYLSFDDIRSICTSIRLIFGSDSHSFNVWRDIVIDLKLLKKIKI